MGMFRDNRWQIRSDDSVWMFPADVTLCTTQMPNLIGYKFGYKYESCIFTRNGSEVLARYNTKKDAMKRHRELEKQYNLKRIK